MSDLLISQLAERTGVPATTLRFYETAGLLPAGRTAAGYRVYGEDAVGRLSFITAAKRLGLPLEEIAGLLDVWAGGSCSQVRDSLLPRLTARIADAGQRASELAAFTATLYRARERLAALPGRDSACGPQCESLLTGPAAPGDGTRDTAPAACSLDSAAMGSRITEWRDLLAGAQSEPVPGGMRLSMPADRAARAAGLAAAEQQCCPFLDFRLHLLAGRLHLEVRAPAGAAGLLAGLLSQDEAPAGCP
jgi:MerR family copper efflux transcriptional regulator